jgi:hypothetical protein
MVDMSDADYESLALERRCVHCEADADGGLYPGRDYLRALQRHRGDEALRLARRVGPFFWGDADIIRVRLCRPCADELGIEESPRDGSACDAPPAAGRERGAKGGRRLIDRQRGYRRKTRIGLLHSSVARVNRRGTTLRARPRPRAES